MRGTSPRGSQKQRVAAGLKDLAWPDSPKESLVHREEGLHPTRHSRRLRRGAWKLNSLQNPGPSRIRLLEEGGGLVCLGVGGLQQPYGLLRSTLWLLPSQLLPIQTMRPLFCVSGSLCATVCICFSLCAYVSLCVCVETLWLCVCDQVCMFASPYLSLALCIQGDGEPW